MSGYEYHGPDYRALLLAQFLDKSGTTMPDDVTTTVAEVLREQASYAASKKAQYDREVDRVAELQAVLATDETLPSTSSAGCEADVYRSRSFHAHRCNHRATVIRRWATREFVGPFIDGQSVVSLPVGWGVKVPSANPYTPDATTVRPLTDEERERTERRYETKEHVTKLCGTHRNQRGQYGLPY